MSGSLICFVQLMYNTLAPIDIATWMHVYGS